MKAREIFDSCHARYRGLQEWLADSTGQVRALDLENPSSGYHWRPVRARAPVNAPASVPNSSASINSLGRAPRLTLR